MQAVIKVTPSQLTTIQKNYPTNRQLPPGAVFAHQANEAYGADAACFPAAT